MAPSASLPELLLPAGGFDSAIAAIEGGADALYLGFADFSARKQAKNFDRLEYRRLYRLAPNKGIKLYAALNTIVLQDELEGASALLAFLGRFPPDAVLVQDWGLAALIRARHPLIAIHASTQTAAQGFEAARVARELGASRIVLPRETSLAEMERLHEEEPGIEYEAFVHGALCYSFSGLCLASGMVLGRSGNRGECAQLCRSYYRAEDGRGAGGGGMAGRTGYWFSCRDLELGARVGELARAGICSVKVEGRMKSPEYCYAVARLYRGHLDALKGEGPGVQEMSDRLEAARIAFSRSPSEAWLFERGGSRLIDSSYPGHRGVAAGRIVKAQGRRLVLDLDSPLGLRDGLLGFESGDESRPIRFPALALRDAATGRELFQAKAGTLAEIDAPADDGRAPELRVGDELRRISARGQDRRAASPEEYPVALQELDFQIDIGPSGIAGDLSLPSFGGGICAAKARARIEEGGPVTLDVAKVPGGFGRALALFSESGEADFRLVPRIDADASIELPADSKSALPRTCRMVDLFMPPSALKREKNRIYGRAAELVAGAEIAYAIDSAAWGKSLGDKVLGSSQVRMPPRAALVFPREGLSAGMPFATRRDLVEAQPLPSWGGNSWLPLAPLVFDRGEYARLVRERVRKGLAGGAALGDRLVVGIAALHHVAIARGMLADNKGSGDRLSFFLDFNLYVANEPSFASLSSLLPRVEFAYEYLEAARPSLESPSSRIAPIGAGFEAPLFQSLGCLYKQHENGGSCPESCRRSWSALLSDRDRRYRVIVEDCVSYLFRIGAERNAAS